ncbi:hypothetical protein K435DRAFT_839199 [Dendrothele bispora CBS 962.96]|uniref:Uncharacterized protein n=1 Tax=Dendrothele bispora (strain CBS 962.96) TaxID=1314807 RepID=A0A4S8M206_DENBC|nr:hypothetical protein K435DRAFT_839199 [Dendrothele bispora CBS 962.96]
MSEIVHVFPSGITFVNEFNPLAHRKAERPPHFRNPDFRVGLELELLRIVGSGKDMSELDVLKQIFSDIDEDLVSELWITIGAHVAHKVTPVDLDSWKKRVCSEIKTETKLEIDSDVEKPMRLDDFLGLAKSRGKCNEHNFRYLDRAETAGVWHYTDRDLFFINGFPSCDQCKTVRLGYVFDELIAWVNKVLE